MRPSGSARSGCGRWPPSTSSPGSWWDRPASWSRTPTWTRPWPASPSSGWSSPPPPTRSCCGGACSRRRRQVTRRWRPRSRPGSGASGPGRSRRAIPGSPASCASAAPISRVSSTTAAWSTSTTCRRRSWSTGWACPRRRRRGWWRHANAWAVSAARPSWRSTPSCRTPPWRRSATGSCSSGTERPRRRGFDAGAAFRGGDAAASLANLVAGSDGALFTGPTASNRIWDQLTDDREPGSPVCRPVYDGGIRVRFPNRPADQERPTRAGGIPGPGRAPPLGPGRDETLEAFWRRPEWTDRPQGSDVPARAGWYPVVIGLQEIFDLIAGFSAASGHGHNNDVDFVSGWAAVAPPADWTAADSAPPPAAPPILSKERDANPAQPYDRPRPGQAGVGHLPGRAARRRPAHAVRAVPGRPGRQRRLARLRRRPRPGPSPALRLPCRRGRVRPDLRPHPRPGPALLGRPGAAAARRDQHQRRRPRRLLGGPERPLPGDHHPALRQRRLSPSIAGYRTHHGNLIEGTWKPIIPREQWELLKALLEDPAWSTGRRGHPAGYLLTGLVVCGVCGHRMVVDYNRRGGGRRVRSYKCKHRPAYGGCGRVSRNAETIENLIVETLFVAVESDDFDDLRLTMLTIRLERSVNHWPTTRACWTGWPTRSPRN